MTLHVEESGPADAPAIVLLHGVANSRRTFAFAVGALGDDVRLVRADLRGHGASPRVPGAYRLDDHVDDVVELLERTGTACVVGNSLGGAIAWTVAQRRPDLVTAALLEDPPLRRPDEAGVAPPLFRQLRDQAARWQADDVAASTVAAALAGLPGPGGQRAGDVQTADAVEARAGALLDLDVTVLDAVLDGTLLDDLDVDAPVSVPVRVLASDEAHGSALPAAGAAALIDAHPEVSFRRLAGAGHVIHDEVAHRGTWLAEVRALLA